MSWFSNHWWPCRQKNPRWLRELVTRFFTTVLSIVGLSLFAAAIPRWNNVSAPPTEPISGKWQDGIPMAPLATSILSNIAISFYIAQKRHPPHLAAQLVLDFVVWATLIPAITFAARGATFWLWKPVGTDGLNIVMCHENPYARECFPGIYELGSLELAGVIFACASWALHFSLFLYTIYIIRSRGWQPKYRRRRRRHRRHRYGDSKEQIFVCLDDKNVMQDYAAPYQELVNEVSFPERVMTK